MPERGAGGVVSPDSILCCGRHVRLPTPPPPPPFQTRMHARMHVRKHARSLTHAHTHTQRPHSFWRLNPTPRYVCKTERSRWRASGWVMLWRVAALRVVLCCDRHGRTRSERPPPSPPPPLPLLPHFPFPLASPVDPRH